MPKNSRNAPKRQTRIFYRNLQCFEPSQGCCEQSLYRAQGHFCWYLRCFLRFLAAHNGPFLGQNGPANLKFGAAPPPDPPPQTIYANNSQRYCAFRHHSFLMPNPTLKWHFHAGQWINAVIYVTSCTSTCRLVCILCNPSPTDWQGVTLRSPIITTHSRPLIVSPGQR